MQRIRKIKPLYFKLRLLTEFCWNILEYEKELLKIMELFIIGEEKFSRYFSELYEIALQILA